MSKFIFSYSQLLSNLLLMIYFLAVRVPVEMMKIVREKDEQVF